ncbi:hypothetical protein HQ677_12100 [Enterococcus faecium]|nr:hypothetical protein [Enterococcus faecium]
MKIAIISETPFQLYNAINLICGFQKDVTIDLYISIFLPKMELYANRLSEKKWFRGNVIVLTPADNLLERIRRYILRGVSPKCALKSAMQDKKIRCEKEYEEIYMGCPNPLSFNLANAYTKSSVIFYEEGTGSYHGKIGTSVMSKRLKLQQMLTNKGPEKIEPKQLLLYEPQLCRSEYKTQLGQLPKISAESETYKKMKDVFCYDIDVEEQYSINNVVYLGQPQYPYYNGDYDVSIKMIEEELMRFNERVIYRPHPSQNEIDHFKHVDISRSQWEVLSGILSEDKVLIGICSTAQFTPKYIYDKEPVLIFTLQIFDNYCPVETKVQLLEMIEDMKSIYKHKERIICPKSVQDLSIILEGLFNGKNNF